MQDNRMEFVKLGLDGPIEIVPAKIADDRGYFSEIFRSHAFAEHVRPVEFVQDNQSLSVRMGTVRGLHFQTHPSAQGKLVRCLAGRLLDIAVDLRADSPAFGRWVSVVLSPENNNQLWVPVGFGHGFCTLEPDTVISYRVTNYYSRDDDKGVAWDDPDIAITWPEVADVATLSAKDRTQPSLRELPPYFSMKDS
jgi:dTDP-4-dehydrorhamnose 3,5-epimerase